MSLNWWKGKLVAGNEPTHVLADSHPPPSQPQQYPQEEIMRAEDLHGPRLGSVASYLYSFVAGGNASGGSKSNELTRRNSSPRSSPRLFSGRWRRRKSYKKDSARPLDETDRSLHTTIDSTDGGSEELMEWQACSSNKLEDAVVNFLPDMVQESSFISPDLYEFFHSCLPNIVKGCQWMLLYSTLKHGISLQTLIRKSAELPGYCLLIVGDKKGAIFGGLLEGPLRPTAKKKYQGTNQAFVFTTIYGNPRLFRATGANRFYYLCLHDMLAFGGGGSFALCLDGDLLHGTSGPCETFGSLCLANSPDFELKNVELWGFTHSSRHYSTANVG